MAIEPIKGIAMTYQGSSISHEAKAVETAKVERAEAPVVSDTLAKDTMAMNTKETNADGGGNQGNGTTPQQQAQIKKAVEEINKKANNSEAIFGVHDGTNRVTIKIVDKQTKEIIKEFPPDKTLDMIARVWEMAGLMVDEKR